MLSNKPKSELTPDTPGGPVGGKQRQLLFAAFVLICTFLVFLPSLRNGFVNWDDQVNIYKNPHITNISGWESLFKSLAVIFTEPVVGNYNPLPIASFAFEKMLFGLDRPEWFHFNNILLHLVCTFLVFRIAQALGLSLLPAALCSLLFGIHPMRVESVAWITERKDVLFGAFFLAAFYFYIKRVKSSFKVSHEIIILTCFILALLSKIQAVCLPLSMLLVDYYFKRKLTLRLIYEKWLYFSLSLATGLIGIYFINMELTQEIHKVKPLIERVFIGSYAYVVYLLKSLIPYKLVPVYSYPASLTWEFYASLLTAMLVLAMIFYSFLLEKRIVVFGLMFFTFNIMFLLQIFSVGQGFLADRFTYIAYFGLFFLYAYGFQSLMNSYPKAKTWLIGLVTLVLTAYGIISFEQNKIWENGETLWTHVLKYYPSTSMVWENRASYFGEAGRFKEALEDYDQAISLNPESARTYISRGDQYLYSDLANKQEAALKDYNMAILLSPGNAEYRIKRAKVLSQLEKPALSLQDLNAAEQMTPGNPEIFSLRSKIYFNQGQYDKARSDIEDYLRLQPEDSSMWSNLGTLFRRNQQFSESIEAFNQAIQIKPDHLDYYYQRSISYYMMGNRQRAQEDLDFLKSKGFEGIHPDYENLIIRGQ